MSVLIKPQALPKILTFGDIKYYIFSLSFTALAVFVPWFLHKFSLLGPQFLPMHFFVLAAGLFFGWRAGIVVGAFSPLMSYSLSQMPPLVVLPQIVFELAVYGLAIGLLREKKTNLFASLLAAMVLGRLARILFILALAPKMPVFQFIETSWLGIVLQLVLIPLFVFAWKRSFKNS